MIAVIKPDATETQRNHLIDWLKGQNVDVHISEGKEYTVLGLVGNTSEIDVELIESLSIVESVKVVSEPFKKSNRNFHPENTVITVGDAVFGNGDCAFIAGPCYVEDTEEFIGLAQKLKAAGANVLRVDAYRKRFSPYESIREMGNIQSLLEAKKATGMVVAAEIMDLAQLSRIDDVDIIQIGARNMQNYELLRELGKMNKPVILKRGLSSNLKELLMSAEYIMAGGNENVILCERGIRTFETYTRNTLDLSAIPLLHELSHLPVIVDPGSATGAAKLIKPMSMAAAACGADGIMVDVYNDPMKALYDGAHAFTPEQFAETVQSVRTIRGAIR